MIVNKKIKILAVVAVFLGVIIFGFVYFYFIKTQKIENENEMVGCGYDEPMTKKEIREKNCECYAVPNTKEAPAWKCKNNDQPEKEIKDENENLSRQEKCEKSGGKWDYVICNMPGCKPIYYCNCSIEEKTAEENELFKRDSKFLIQKDDICIACEQDSDCGKNTCDNDSKCRQHSASCKKGFCYTKEYFSTGNGNISYDCVNNECKIKGDNLGYIKYLHTNSYYSQGENIITAVKIKNISSSSHNFKITFEVKKEYSDVVVASKSLTQVIDSNIASEIKVEIPTFDLELEKGSEGFDLFVTVSDAGTIKERIVIKQKEQVIVEFLDISGKLSKSEYHNSYAIFKAKIKNPTEESFRAFVDLYVYKDDGRTLITKRPQMFVDLNPNETKEITDHWNIDKLEPGSYSLQAIARVGNYKISENPTDR